MSTKLDQAHFFKTGARNGMTAGVLLSQVDGKWISVQLNSGASRTFGSGNGLRIK